MSTWQTESGATLTLDDSMTLAEHRRFVARVHDKLDPYVTLGWRVSGFGFELLCVSVSERHELYAAAYGAWRPVSL